LEEKNKKIMPKDVAFVLDTSGSMAGKKLEQAKKALRFCVENLNEEDHLRSSGSPPEVEPLFERLVEATPKNRNRANDFITGLKPIGARPLTMRCGKR